MSNSLEKTIEDCLSKTGYHPDLAANAKEKAEAYIRSLKPTPDAVQANMEKLRSMMNDAVLMEQKYFAPRVKFLSGLVHNLDKRPESHLDVADDGCGTGVDLYVLNNLLGNKLSLTGIDINDTSLSAAHERVPDAKFQKDFNDATFDVIYSDFFSIGQNSIFEIIPRGAKAFNALRSPGVVLQNADMGKISLFCNAFGQRFSRIIQPELLGRVENKPDCYLYRYEKD